MSEGLITWRISARLLKEILLKSNCRLRGEGFSPAKRARKSEEISFNRNGISARAEKAGNNMAAAKKQKRFQWN